MTLLIIIIFLIYYRKNKAYLDSEYYKESGNSYLSTKYNAGIKGEYLTFEKLNMLNYEKKILTNLYIPRENGKTTEVDLVVISKKGFFVIESKNYSGWVYGNEKYKYWTQTFRKGRKYQFYNPIWQNQLHINELSNLLMLDNNNFFHSYIIFSNQCEIKKIEHSENVKVINLYQLAKTLTHHMNDMNNVLSSNDIERYYNYLRIYSNVEDSIKSRHIETINSAR